MGHLSHFLLVIILAMDVGFEYKVQLPIYAQWFQVRHTSLEPNLTQIISNAAITLIQKYVECVAKYIQIIIDLSYKH